MHQQMKLNDFEGTDRNKRKTVKDLGLKTERMDLGKKRKGLFEIMYGQLRMWTQIKSISKLSHLNKKDIA